MGKKPITILVAVKYENGSYYPVLIFYFMDHPHNDSLECTRRFGTRQEALEEASVVINDILDINPGMEDLIGIEAMQDLLDPAHYKAGSIVH